MTSYHGCVGATAADVYQAANVLVNAIFIPWFILVGVVPLYLVVRYLRGYA